MTREEIAALIEEHVSAHVEHHRGIPFPRLSGIEDAAEAILSKLHQDAGNGELVARLRAIKGPHNVVRACFEAADALERGSQVVEMPSVQWIGEQAKSLSSAKDEDSVGALAWNLRVAFQRWADKGTAAPAHGGGG